jgi:hypothetical protein
VRKADRSDVRAAPVPRPPTRQSRIPRLLMAALLAGLALGCFPGVAVASAIIDRDPTNVTLQVDPAGQALVSYRVHGKLQHVLAWGAVNAIAPTRAGSQVAFKFDYSGGYQSRYKTNPVVKKTLNQLRTLQGLLAKATAAHDNPRRYQIAPRIADAYRTLDKLRKQAATFDNVCGPYQGPPLPWLLVACTAPDGSFWALQSWQRALPDLGELPWLPAQSAWELHLSHWSGPLPVLEIHLDWVNTQKARHLFGRLTYLDQPVYGFGSKSDGNPTDGFGRNIYVDVFNAPGYGPGWRRENSFLAHNPNGNFCYGFYPHKPYAGYPRGDRPAGVGERYRATVPGPGVLPDVGWEGDDIGAWNPDDSQDVSYELQMNALSDTFAAGDRLCHQH